MTWPPHPEPAPEPTMAAADAEDWCEPVHADRAAAMEAVRVLLSAGWVVAIHPGDPIRQDALTVRFAAVVHPANSEVVGEIRYLDPAPHEPGG